MSKLPPEQHLRCERCGHDRAEHHAANLADGPLVGQFFLVCPTAVLKAAKHDVFGLPYESDLKAAAAPPAPGRQVQHGRDCPKASHGAGGYMHLPDDDGPYDVDGVIYCGRCHAWIERAQR